MHFHLLDNKNPKCRLSSWSTQRCYCWRLRCANVTHSIHWENKEPTKKTCSSDASVLRIIACLHRTRSWKSTRWVRCINLGYTPRVLEQLSIFSTEINKLQQISLIFVAYLLADAGYDVWMGNARGTDMSRDHISLSADKPTYWDYSWQDIGQKDLPAFIDYVLRETKAPKLDYVGFSLGELPDIKL